MSGVPTPCRLCRYSLFFNIWLFDSLVTKQFGSHKCGDCCPSGLMGLTRMELSPFTLRKG